MGTKTLSQIVSSGGAPKLAPQLDWPLTSQLGNLHTIITGIDATAALTTCLSLTGKWIIRNIWLSLLTVDDIETIKLTIDGVVIWNDDPVLTAITELMFGQVMGVNSHSTVLEDIMCESSFLLEIKTTADADIRCNYLARALL